MMSIHLWRFIKQDMALITKVLKTSYFNSYGEYPIIFMVILSFHPCGGMPPNITNTENAHIVWTHAYSKICNSQRHPSIHP